MPFQWMILKPDIGMDEESSNSKAVVTRAMDAESVFSVHPPSGFLPPDEEMEFKVTFAPPVVNDYHSVLHMVLQHIPQYQDGDSAKLRRTQSREGTPQSSDSEGENDESTPPEVFPAGGSVYLRYENFTQTHTLTTDMKSIDG